MKKKEKTPASIPLAEVYKELAQEYREKAQRLIECADIMEGKEPTNDKYDLLKEFVGYWHRHWGNNWGIYNYAVNDSVDIALEQFIKENEK